MGGLLGPPSRALTSRCEAGLDLCKQSCSQKGEEENITAGAQPITAAKKKTNVDEKYYRKLRRVHLLEIDDGSAATVDLSPILFAKVLQYLRTNNTIYVSTSIALAELKEECRFFDLDESAIKVPCQRVRTFPLQHSVPAALRGTSRVHSPCSTSHFHMLISF